MNKLPLFAAALLLLSSAVAFAKPAAISCPQKTGGELGVNNEQVIEWLKASSKEFIRARAHISGKVVRVHPANKAPKGAKEPDPFHTKHQRYQVKIGPGKFDIIDVFYNGKYMPRPALKKGDTVEACGEFAADMTGDPKVSPGFAVLYWVHSASNFPHPEGYLKAQGQVFGAKVAQVTKK